MDKQKLTLKKQLKNSRLRDILDEVIRDGFPELLSEDIQIEFASLDDALMEFGDLTGEGYFIEVDNSLETVLDLKEIHGLKVENIIAGGVAHELAHIVAQKQMGRRLSIRDKIAYRVSKRYKTLDERNTDLDVILRGYASELFDFLNFAKESGLDHWKEDGLSIREVERLLLLSRY